MICLSSGIETGLEDGEQLIVKISLDLIDLEHFWSLYEENKDLGGILIYMLRCLHAESL